jgi:histidinol-phosphatase
VKPWDIAALVPIVREAGGAVTDVTGGDRLDTLSIVASNGALHGAVLDHLGVG